jgi:3-dehydroquinate synthase
MQIYFENQGFDQLRNLLRQKQYSSYFILVDENTDLHCRPILEEAIELPFKKILISAGEQFKNIETCTKIWQFLLDNVADRNALLINLGGGVIGDMGGFCAVTYKRGIDFVQIPTTLLSMVDASVGGKLGIDFGHVKNSIGAFQNPIANCIYDGFLKTLPFRELRSGFAEIIKHALISDKNYWEEIKKIDKLSDENIDWQRIIKKSTALKTSIVEKDPQENGLRKILNFGHSIGHALESLSLETAHPLLHGEAVAIGMICEAYYSNKLLSLSEAELKEITYLMTSQYPYRPLDFFNVEKFESLLMNDKKNRGGVSFSLLNGIGDAVFDAQVPRELIYEGLEFYSKISKAIN